MIMIQNERCRCARVDDHECMNTGRSGFRVKMGLGDEMVVIYYLSSGSRWYLPTYSLQDRCLEDWKERDITLF